MLAGLDAGGVTIRGLGEAHVDIALEHLRTGFTFVGLVERIGRALPDIMRADGA